jgi:hypothetical protein
MQQPQNRSRSLDASKCNLPLIPYHRPREARFFQNANQELFVEDVRSPVDSHPQALTQLLILAWPGA